MATGYGGWLATDDWRAIVDASITENDETQATVRVTVKIQSVYVTSSSARGRTGKSGSYGGWTYVTVYPGGTYTMRSDTYTITKTHSAQTIAFQGQGNIESSGYGGSGTSTAQVSLSIGAKKSYSVTYNANGGSGAPAAQTKWHGENLTLSSTRPTRANYNFKGWSTQSSGTVSYAAGATYTNNAALVLYAVWELAAASPTLSSFSAYRSDSSGVADGSSTEYFTVKAVWTVDSNASSKSIKFVYTPPGGSSPVTKTVTLSGTSGTTTQTYACTLPADKKMPVVATVTDATHSLSISKTATVTVVFKPFTLANKGLSAAFFGMAGATWNRILHVFGDFYQTKDVPRHYKHFSSHNTQVGAESAPTAWTELESYCSYDSAGNQAYYSQLAFPANSTSLYRSYVVRRLDASGSAMLGGFYTYLDADGTSRLVLAGTNAKGNWFNAIGGWTQLATAKSGTQMTFTIPASCTELLVAAVCTSAVTVDGVSTRRYAGSVVIPKALLSTSLTEWALGGGSAGNVSSASGTRYAAVRITTTKAIGQGAYADGTNYASTTTFYIYWR